MMLNYLVAVLNIVIVFDVGKKHFDELMFERQSKKMHEN